jgi:acyl-coenzyme A thioesterase PaaI-like protein
MTAKAADKLKSDGWKIVETSGFLHLIGPLWQRVVDGTHEYALATEDKHHNRRGLVQGGVIMTFADRTCGMTARFVGKADAGNRAARYALRGSRQDRRGSGVETARGTLHPQPHFYHDGSDRRQALYRDGERGVQDIEE